MSYFDDKMKVCVDLGIDKETIDKIREIFAEYKIDENGVIQNPGKFECEMWYAPLVYDWMMDGDGEDLYDGEDEDAAINETVFELTKVEQRLFDTEATVLSLTESDTGFVSVTPKVDE